MHKTFDLTSGEVGVGGNLSFMCVPRWELLGYMPMLSSNRNLPKRRCLCESVAGDFFLQLPRCIEMGLLYKRMYGLIFRHISGIVSDMFLFFKEHFALRAAYY